MQLIDGQPVFSASDLVGFLACEHLTHLERAAMAGLVERPHRDDPELDVLRRRGEQHEQRYLADLETQGRNVVRIERHDDAERGERIRLQAHETLAAMQTGADVIYQATFFDGRWLGYADFLLRMEADAGSRPPWGPWYYEVADTKLAHHVKAGAVLQICSYVDQLERIQRVMPREMRVVLGGSAREEARLRVADFMSYYRAAKARFEAAVLGTDGAPPPTPSHPPASTYPEPVEHCDVCRWSVECEARRRRDDHLSLVAGITAHQRKALGARGIETLTALAGSPIPFDPPLDGASALSAERVREQARIQLEGRGVKPPPHELLLPKPGELIDPERGLATLPAPDPGDLFFDIEGDPYAFDDGIEYLFGVLDTDGEFRAFWSFDPSRPQEIDLAGEKAAFEAFIDFVEHRRRRYPGMHVYHYAPYEPTALKRLMGRHATREAEVDALLRGGILVDLYRAVRQGLRAAVESYSIKKLEPIYGFHREIDLRDAGSSIVAFEEWLELGDGDRPASDILARIEGYNRDDVVSNARLRDWLEALRVELAGATGQDVPRPQPRAAEPPDSLSEAAAAVQVIADRLTAGVPVNPTERTHEQAAAWLLAQLLSWHRRESKATFWDFFRRIGLTPEELAEEDGAVGQLELVSISEPYLPTPRSKLHRRRAVYAFPAQEHRNVSDRSELYDPALAQEHAGELPWETWRIQADLGEIDDQRGTLEVIWKVAGDLRHPRAIVALNRVPDKPLPGALLRLGTWVADQGVLADGPWRAARDLLLRRPPRCGQEPGAPLRRQGEDDLEAACRLVSCLESGTLAIQGPPGSGKTYTAAEMAVRLIAAGKRVGISATSHKVIENFLGKIFEAADRRGVDVRAVQKPGDDGTSITDQRLLAHGDNGKVREALQSGACNLGAGTPWLWGREDFEGIVDVLFVDEAGQISLANVLAMGGATGSLVLMGDPQQLEQPLQGSHPPGADRSALGHLLGDEPTMPPDRGLFLEHTWRMHPTLTRFTSSAFYEGRLQSRDHLAAQILRGPGPIGGVGARLLAAEHTGSDNVSPEEARQVAALATTLVGSGATWVDQQGRECPMSWDDVLIVAPYNAQVGEIRRHLPPEARVGTVDKFQGQEAPISIYSMTSSSVEDAPRGMAFLYSRNRLNVATSRARCVAVVVASPELLRVRARSVEEMRLANALARFAEMAAPGQSGQ